jgi:DNA-binding NtrC family response regulator
MTQVLVVDDDAAIRESLSLALVGEFDVTAVSSAAEALDHLSRERPEVMVLDQFMPGMSGLGLLERLHGGFIPATVMLSALADTDMARQAMHLGADDLLAKPYDLAALKLKLHAAADRPRLGLDADTPLALRGARILAEAVAATGPLAQRSAQLSRLLVAEAITECRGDRKLAAERLDLDVAELNRLAGDLADN